MSHTIPLLFASIFIHSGGGPVTGFEVILFLLAAGAVVVVAVSRAIVGGWIERTRCRTWPTVSAVVDIVSVAYCEPAGSPILHFQASFYNLYYQATLTYKYLYPEEQMGDYSRSFGKKEDAEAWANSYKGETIKVHVDPSDPTHSVLREEDL